MDNTTDIKRKIIPILKKHRVKRAGLFIPIGCSQADIGLLVSTDRKTGLLDFVGMKQEIEDVLGKKVDIGEYQSLKPAIKDEILNGEVPVL